MKNDNTHSVKVLEPGTILQDNYIIDTLLGEGGFGITYSGTRLADNSRVAIKEYFPAGLATRGSENGTFFVSHFQGELGISFDKGMTRFLKEAELLKDFNHLDSIVSVLDVFKTNGTAYIVMEYIEGITLKQYLEENGVLSFSELLALCKPVISALIEVHKCGLIHRDISPDNLMIGLDNHLHLIDFGAAGSGNPNETKTMTVILKSGYAPPEQYLSDGKTGPWTDVYGLAATMYKMLTGVTPIESIRRIQNDTLEPVSISCTDILPWQESAILHGLALEVSNRFRTMQMFLNALMVEPSIEENVTVVGDSNHAIATTTADTLGLDSSDISPISSRKNVIFKRIIMSGIAIIFACTITYVALGKAGVSVPGWEFFASDMNSDVANDNQTDTNSNNPSDSNNSIDEKQDNNADSDNNNTSRLISENETILTMINTVGTRLETAKKDLSKLDSSISIQVVEEYNKDVSAGIVFSQSVSENTQFTSGNIQNIILTVSKGTEPTTEASTKTASGNKNGNNSGDYNVQGDNENSKDDAYTTIKLD